MLLNFQKNFPRSKGVSSSKCEGVKKVKGLNFRKEKSNNFICLFYDLENIK